jgi:hypothetical protein
LGLAAAAVCEVLPKLLVVKGGSEVAVEPVWAFELLPLKRGSLRAPFGPCIKGVCARID